MELAQLQDEEVGDGTTSVVILAAELLKVSRLFGMLFTMQWSIAKIATVNSKSRSERPFPSNLFFLPSHFSNDSNFVFRMLTSLLNKRFTQPQSYPVTVWHAKRPANIFPNI